MKQKLKQSMLVGSFLAFICIFIWLINGLNYTDYTMYTNDGINYEKATVIEVLYEEIVDYDELVGLKLGTQTLLIEFKEGVQKGEQIEIINNLSTTHSILTKAGTNVIIKADRPENITPYFTVYNYDRQAGLVTVALIFIVCMALVAKTKGIKSVIGLGMSLVCISRFLLPAIYRGWSPIYMTIITVIVITAISLVLLNGFCEKTYVALISTAIGVIISAIFFFILQRIMNLSGYSINEAESLLIIGEHTGLKIQEVLFSAVLISSLGAVIDTTMSIASSLYEIREVHPEIDKKTLIKSGVTIGQDMIGTMCQTLILAFVGGSIATLLLMFSYGTTIDQFLSSDYLAIEVVQAISGSMAIIFAVPITAILCTVSKNKVVNN